MPDEADYNLVSEQISGLNEQFYRGDPADYFARRSTAMLISVARPDLVRSAMREGVEYGTLKVKETPDQDDEGDTDTERRVFASTESVAILHHCAEALFRLILAHRGVPPCPWLEVARLRDFRQFKAQLVDLRATLSSDGTMDDVVTVLRGTPDRTQLSPTPDQAAWERDQAGLRMLLAILADRLLGEGNLYNAAKHGLAVVGGDVGLRLGDEDWPDVSAEGPSLTHLERRELSPSDRKRWYKTLTWVNVERNLGWTHLASCQMRSLWTAARARYTGVMTGKIWPVSPDAVDALLKGNGKPYQPLGFSEQLAYWTDDPSPQD